MTPALVSAVLALALAAPGSGDRCFVRKASGNSGAVMIYRGDRSCHDFDAPVTVSGLWIDEFEGQRLIPQGRTLEDALRVRRDHRARRIWFTTDEETRWTDPGRVRRGGPGAAVYRIRVAGRHARKIDPASPGGFGHLGSSDGLFLADRIISIDHLGSLDR